MLVPLILPNTKKMRSEKFAAGLGAALVLPTGPPSHCWLTDVWVGGPTGVCLHPGQEPPDKRVTLSHLAPVFSSSR